MTNKILLISHCMPPIVRGPSIIIKRLFSCFPQNSYCVLTSRYENKGLPIDEGLKLPCNYHYIEIETVVGGYRSDLLSRIKKWIDTLKIIVKTIRVVKEERCDGLLVFPTHGNCLIASYIAHKILGIDLYIYFFDLFTYKSERLILEKTMRYLAQYLSVKSAKKIFVMSEKLKEYYDKRFPGIEIILVRHSVKIDNNPGQFDVTRIINKNGKKQIIFAGMIYEYQIDAIQNMSKAIEKMNDVEFHIYTPREKEYLESMGVLRENVVYCGFKAENEMRDILRNADLLFLPMSFHGKGTDPEVIKTASPSKIAEYLNAGRPILVHAPSDSYVSWYAKEYGWGMVVDKQDIVALRSAIMELIDNKQLREKIIINAGKAAKMHDVLKVSHDFMKELKIVSA